MLGLRRQEENSFMRFFEIVQKAASENGCTFFCDTAQGIEFTSGDIEGDVLTGWLIPNDKANEFDELFRNDKIDSNIWDDKYVEAVWSLDNGKISVKFD